VDRLVEARWTDAIHDEWIQNLTHNAPAIPREHLLFTRRLMSDALPAAMISRYEEHQGSSCLIQTIALLPRRQSLPTQRSFSLGICTTFPPAH